MSIRSRALALAAKYGFVLDEANSGVDPGGGFTAILDHPTHSICGDCRSITCTSFPPAAATYVWSSLLERLEAEGPFLQPCTDPECEYHNEIDYAVTLHDCGQEDICPEDE